MAFLTAEKVKTIKENTGADKRYLNISKLSDSQPTRIRFVGEGITGFLAWSVNKKPLRWEICPEVLPETVKPDDNGDRTAKFFMTGICWDYDNEMFRVVEITQKSILGDLQKYMADEDYGDPCGYDIVITRTGSGLDTRYETLPKPPKPLASSIEEAFEAIDWDLHQLYDGRHPWAAEGDDTTGSDAD